MNENELFRDKIQELEHLTKELNDMKALLRDISAKMFQIERHVKRAFIPLTKRESDGQSKSRRKSNKVVEPPTITQEEALSMFDELKHQLATNEAQEITVKLDQISTPNLKLMAREVGLSFKGKPSKKILINKILGRMNESLMLSKNTNITNPRNVEIQKEEVH